ncbi:nucleolar gtp-binding protein [Anaeramoeba flamelloides]|uniref:Nucleolar gtp-binding protein n=1 Tax=Anaeramoeba flamelloides TaxID=1746091 RepID=A0AAV7YEC7_9EUKA|nr:nucleolar gtp-binding protein [Anaeramoeba flamelloides]
MSHYNFRKIRAVLPSKQFVDNVLNKTQRRTPTVIRPGFKIIRIRDFYIRKVRTVQSMIHDKFGQILDDFPDLNSIHPFYSDLLNILYDRDHYKIALGSMSISRNIVDHIAKHYISQIKYGDSLFRCKTLKRAALGRLCTVIRKQKDSLSYLEQVRQHLSRYPSIDPTTRTLIITGYPNVGKSSFMNTITRANVDVQPYPFTTKSLFVGHFDYDFQRWQCLDTPGILDHPLIKRNTIEMQAITALAYIKSTILFFIDISETCGYSIHQQVTLFRSISRLFVGKPIVLVLSKIDLRKPNELSQEERKIIECVWDKELPKETFSDEEEENENEKEKEELDEEDEEKDLIIGQENDESLGMALFNRELDWNIDWELKDGFLMASDERVKLVAISSKGEMGIAKVIEQSCDLLKSERVEKKVRSSEMDKNLNRLHVAIPEKRDEFERPPNIPKSILEMREKKKQKGYVKPKKTLSRDLEKQNGGYGKYDIDLRKEWILENEEWKDDIIPEIWEGKNIADFIDPEIERKLDELEKEEEEIIRKMEEADSQEMEVNDLNQTQEKMLDKIREKKMLKILKKNREKTRGRKSIPTNKNTKKSISSLKEHLKDMGLPDLPLKQAKKRHLKTKRGREKLRKGMMKELQDTQKEVQIGQGVVLNKDRSRVRSRSVDPRYKGFKDETQLKLARKIAVKQFEKKKNRYMPKGEGDRSIVTYRPKHLFSGKRGIGSADWR